ncbi:MAG: glycosyltransferase family 2 protein [Ruminococcus sp.]|nr:glycosyltransferase family 2 protein [Ruminococcus sp.]
MNERPITIIVTVYNIEPYLERFFKCLEAQTFSGYEALIIDDGSTDNSLSICEKHAAKDDRIHVVHSEHIGISQARNIALSMLQTPLATSLDGDDYFEKDYLKHLYDAWKKYNADFIISNVITHNEALEETSRFTPRAEELFEGEQIRDVLPALLSENRLNYLYGKLYRTELLKDIRVEPDVMQGSDTMINCQYAIKSAGIVVIEDYDYNYITYRSRSVTSYKGEAYYSRLLRLNLYVRDLMRENGFYTREMETAVDIRILFVGKIALTRICGAKLPKSEKYKQASQVAQNADYVASYDRQKDRISSLDFRVVPPGTERDYVDETTAVFRDAEKDAKKEKLRSKIPKPLLKAYSKLRNH